MVPRRAQGKCADTPCTNKFAPACWPAAYFSPPELQHSLIFRIVDPRNRLSIFLLNAITNKIARLTTSLSTNSASVAWQLTPHLYPAWESAVDTKRNMKVHDKLHWL